MRKATIAEFAGTREDFAKHCLIDIPFDVLSCVGAKIYRKRLLDDRHIRFDRTYKYNEDAAFMATSLSKAGRVDTWICHIIITFDVIQIRFSHLTDRICS